MKKRIALAVLLAAVLLLFSACVMIQTPVNQTSPESTPAAQTEMRPASSAGVDEDARGNAASSGSVETGTMSPGNGVTEESCAYITAISTRPDGGADITFDYVDWLSGDEARQKYLEDHPGVTEEEMEDAGLLEIGYIRNVNPRLRIYPTGEDTAYYLPDPEDIVVNVSVSRETYLDIMVPAVAEESYLTFVKVRVEDGVIASIEWLYTP